MERRTVSSFSAPALSDTHLFQGRNEAHFVRRVMACCLCRRVRDGRPVTDPARIGHRNRLISGLAMGKWRALHIHRQLYSNRLASCDANHGVSNRRLSSGTTANQVGQRSHRRGPLSRYRAWLPGLGRELGADGWFPGICCDLNGRGLLALLPHFPRLSRTTRDLIPMGILSTCCFERRNRRPSRSVLRRGPK